MMLLSVSIILIGVIAAIIASWWITVIIKQSHD